VVSEGFVAILSKAIVATHPTVASVYIVAKICSNNDLGLYCSGVVQQ
jgi:hypothetical protein